MKHLLGLGLSLLLVGSAGAMGVPGSAVAGEVSTGNEQLDCSMAQIKKLTAGITPVHAAQAYLALKKQSMTSAQQSVESLVATFCQNENEKNSIMDYRMLKKDIKPCVHQCLLNIVRAISNKDLRINVLLCAMGPDVANALQAVEQQFMQTYFAGMQWKIKNNFRTWSPFLPAKIEYDAVAEEAIKDYIVKFMEGVNNTLVRVLADCLEEKGYKIDRKALGIAESKKLK